MGLSAKLEPPGPLLESHELDRFDCGVVALNDWLQRRARANQASGASRTFVVAEADRVVGYYALASGGVTQSLATGRLRRNMPEPVPIVIIGRLAVDRAWAGSGMGRALFADAARRILSAADIVGLRGLLVNAVSENARDFWRALGFESSPLDPMTLMVTLSDVRAALAGGS